MKKITSWKEKLQGASIDKHHFLTNSVAGLSADGSDALDISASGGHGIVAWELRQQVLDEVYEDEVPTAHDQMTQSYNGPLPHSQPWAGQLGQQAAQDGRVEVHQQASLSKYKKEIN